MNDPFERRIRAAAVALWWTTALTVGVLWLQWWLCRSTWNDSPWFQIYEWLDGSTF